MSVTACDFPTLKYPYSSQVHISSFCFFPSICAGFTSGDDSVCLSLFTNITVICLCTKCYPDVKTEEKDWGWNTSTNSKARLGLHPIKRANSALVITGWVKEDGECHSGLVSGLESASILIGLSHLILWLLFSSTFQPRLMRLFACKNRVLWY